MIKMNNWGKEAKEILNQTVLNTGLTCEQILPTTYIPFKASQQTRAWCKTRAHKK